jgi:hypothetical protein
MLIQLPGGSALNVFGTEVGAEDNGEVRLHTQLALSRLIERWRADTHPNIAGLLASYLDQCQELENAIWDVIVARLPDYAEGAQLDALGRLVGQRRNGLGDAAFRAHIKARVRINQSFGQARDVIEMIQLVTASTFHLAEAGTAAFSVWFDEPPENASIGRELASLVKQARAAGVSAYVVMPVAADGAFYGSSYDPTLNAALGYSSSYDSAVGGKYGHAARA